MSRQVILHRTTLALRYAAVVVLAVCATARLASAQSVTGSIEGRVVDGEGAAVAGAAVVLWGAYLQGERGTLTDERGRFRSIGLPVGAYTARVSRIGYRELIIEDIPVRLGETSAIGTLSLEVQAVELQPLVVSGRALAMDPYSTTVGANIDLAVVDEVPLARDYQSLLVFLPHANTSYHGDGLSVAGNNGLENMFYVDGVKVTTPLRATGSTHFPYNFIRQIQVSQGGNEARYGGALGATVNVVTHSGTNDFEAHVFGYFTNRALAGEPRGGLKDLFARHFETYDFGARVSGPIVRDRLWLSAAYNPQVQAADLEALNQGFFEDRRTEHRFATKATWRATARTDVEATVFGDPTVHHRVGPLLPFFTTSELLNPDPFLWRSEEGGTNLALTARHQLGRKGLLEASFARSAGREHRIPDTELGRTEPYFNDFRTSTTGGGAEWTERVSTRRTAASIDATIPFVRHTLSLGARYEENLVDFSVDMPDPGAVLRVGDALWVTTLHRNDLPGLKNRIPALYAEDLWRVNDRVTVTVGVRWDSQYLYGAGDSIAQAFTNQWQPRVGVTYQPGELGTQKVFGSFGRVYQQRPLQSTVFFFAGYRELQGLFVADPREPMSAPFESRDLRTLAARQDGLSGEHHDELTLGYERLVRADTRILVRGVHKVLRDAFVGGLDPQGSWHPGNPGTGELSFMPPAMREYTAVELTAEHRGSSPLHVQLAYVLSRSHGNYTGLFSTDTGAAQPGNNWTFRCAEQGPNSTGLLPTDRPHAIKALGSYLFGFGLSAGAFLTLQSGTPLNELGGHPDCIGDALAPVFLVPRGTAGRTPTTWDLNLRFAYPFGPSGRGRIVLDLLHVASQRRVVAVQQVRQTSDGSLIPTFGAPLAHQAPMTLRLGFELGMGL